MTRLMRGGCCSRDCGLDAVEVAVADGPSNVLSATLPMPAADVPKKCRRETRCRSSMGCESGMRVGLLIRAREVNRMGISIFRGGGFPRGGQAPPLNVIKAHR